MLCLVAGAVSRTIISLSSFLMAKVYYFLKLLKHIKALGGIGAEVEHYLETGKGAKITKN